VIGNLSSKTIIENEDWLSYDATTIAIEFINDNIVEFTASEWASFEKINKPYLRQI
jgi:hypothetical protein